MCFSPNPTAKKDTVPFHERNAMENDQSLREPLLMDEHINGNENNNRDAMRNIVGELDTPHVVTRIKICCFILGLLYGFFALN